VLRFRERRIIVKRALFRCIWILAAAGAVSCSTPADLEDTDAPVFLVVDSLSCASDPCGDVWNPSVGVLEPECANVAVSVEFKDPNETGSHLNDVILDRYRVTWSRTDGGTQAPQGFERVMNERVEAGSSAEFDCLTFLQAVQKDQPPLSWLLPWNGGYEPSTGFTTIGLRMTLQVFGRTLAGRQVYAQASQSIIFADWAN
jgi:hypothetical protein